MSVNQKWLETREKLLTEMEKWGIPASLENLAKTNEELQSLIDEAVFANLDLDREAEAARDEEMASDLETEQRLDWEEDH